MQILFIDESGTPPSIKKAGQAGFFVLGGVVIPEEVWLKLARDLKKIKAAYEVTGEIKWRYFAPEKGGAKARIKSFEARRKKRIAYRLVQGTHGV